MHSPGRLARIDGLRALAALAVLLLHSQILRPDSWLEPVAHYGSLGVQLFFFISGYVIALSWDQPGTTARSFYWRRALRVAPLYYFLLVLAFVFGWANSPSTEMTITNFVLHFFFVHGFSMTYSHAGIGPMWSLTSEVFFYLAFPLLQRISTPWLVGLLLLSLQMPDHDTSPGWFQTFSTTPFGAMRYFALGMLVYRHQDFFATRPARIVSGLFAFLFVATAVLREMEIKAPIWHHNPTDMLLFACPWLVASRSRIMSAILDNRVFAFLGLTSYSIYLWQQPIMFELMKAGLPLSFIPFTVLVCAVSAVSYFVIERPFINLGRYVPRLKPSDVKI
jgi:peptidoglycan/LPS O-acetylase OafA/YrhL